MKNEAEDLSRIEFNQIQNSICISAWKFRIMIREE
jgi:hypothetical protein